ncbi:MAG: lysophospholipid acyltransferase family protein, partial [Thermodesulfobacteriota bacterium]
IKSWIANIVIFLITAFWGTLGIFASFWGSKASVDFCIRPWGRTIIKSFGIKLDVEGIENIPRNCPSLILYNHQSAFDIVAFSAVIPVGWKAVMKRELLFVPFLGMVAKLSGHYFVKRDGSVNDTKQVREIVKDLQTGTVSVVIAPEGTRSEDGKLLPFKHGVFLIASLSGVPIVPMIIWGGKDIRPKNQLKIDLDKTRKMTIRVLPAIDPKDFPKGKNGREQLEIVVRNLMENEIEKIVNQV